MKRELGIVLYFICLLFGGWIVCLFTDEESLTTVRIAAAKISEEGNNLTIMWNYLILDSILYAKSIKV